MKLTGKSALITGATSGIGLATLECFAREGAQVVFCGRREETGKKIEERLRAEGREVLFVKTDCTVDADVDNLVNTALKTYKKIDILFNNAGVLTTFAFEDIDMKKDYEAAMNTNVRSYFYTSKCVLPHMLKAGKGNIINTASIGGLSGASNLATYCTTKGAVIQLTRCLAKEYTGRGIRVNSVSPGLIFTEMMPRDAAFSAEIAARIPMGRGGEPQELAQAVLFLASDDSSFVSGHNLVVDGAQSA